MKKHGKKALSLLLALVLCLGVVPMSAFAAEATSGTCGENVTWKLENGTLTISGTGPMADYEYEGAPWYKIRSDITAVVIEQGVANIGAFAFSGCTAAAGVTIPNSVTGIGEGAFRECTGLTNVVIPDGVTNMGGAVFYDCTGLTSVILPDSVTKIGGFLFSDCSSLTAVALPAGLTEIDDATFSGCAALTSVTIPSGVTKICWSAFEGCAGLTGLALPEGLVEIDTYAFTHCTGLSSLAIPNSVTAFDTSAISGCTSLTSLHIGSGVTELSPERFSGCTSLTDIEISADNPKFKSVDGVVFDKAGTTLLRCPAGKKGTYSIPQGVTAIGERAFEGCSGLTAVAIPDGAAALGIRAFGDCAALAEITIPASVSRVDKNAFEGTAWLKAQSGFMVVNGILLDYRGQETALIIPDGVTVIGPYAFGNCPELTSIVIPASVTSIDVGTDLGYNDAGAFGNCHKLTDVTIENGDAQIGKNAFSWSQQMSMSKFEIMTVNVTVHAPAGGKVEAFCKEHQIKFVSTGDEPVSNLPTVEPIPATGTAVARTQTAKLDGKEVEFQYYAVKDANGNESNYVKVRDLANALNGTKAQFDVGWDQASKKISIIPNTAYQVKGGEGSTPYSGDQPYKAVSDDPVSFNGSQVKLTSFQIKDGAGNGYTYYKLRDLGQLLNFEVRWDNSAKSVVIETDKPFTGK